MAFGFLLCFLLYFLPCLGAVQDLELNNALPIVTRVHISAYFDMEYILGAFIHHEVFSVATNRVLVSKFMYLLFPLFQAKPSFGRICFDSWFCQFVCFITLNFVTNCPFAVKSLDRSIFGNRGEKVLLTLTQSLIGLFNAKFHPSYADTIEFSDVIAFVEDDIIPLTVKIPETLGFLLALPELSFIFPVIIEVQPRAIELLVSNSMENFLHCNDCIQKAISVSYEVYLSHYLSPSHKALSFEPFSIGFQAIICHLRSPEGRRIVRDFHANFRRIFEAVVFTFYRMQSGYFVNLNLHSLSIIEKFDFCYFSLFIHVSFRDSVPFSPWHEIFILIGSRFEPLNIYLFEMRDELFKAIAVLASKTSLKDIATRLQCNDVNTWTWLLVEFFTRVEALKLPDKFHYVLKGFTYEDCYEVLWLSSELKKLQELYVVDYSDTFNFLLSDPGRRMLVIPSDLVQHRPSNLLGIFMNALSRKITRQNAPCDAQFGSYELAILELLDEFWDKLSVILEKRCTPRNIAEFLVAWKVDPMYVELDTNKLSFCKFFGEFWFSDIIGLLDRADSAALIRNRIQELVA